MSPGLKPGQIVFGWGFGKPRAGELVILWQDGLEKIKRVDKIEGHRLYVLGDNPAASTDSRQFGDIDIKQVRARIIWPRYRLN